MRPMAPASYAAALRQDPALSLAPSAQARPKQIDWLSSLTKSSDVTGLAHGKHARIIPAQEFILAARLHYDLAAH